MNDNTDGAGYECMLALAIPARLEEEVFDCLQAHPEWVSGFSAVSAEGFGAGVPLDTPLEQVRGRASRRLVMLLTSHAGAEQLLRILRDAFPSPHVAYWIMPISGFGRFA